MKMNNNWGFYISIYMFLLLVLSIISCDKKEKKQESVELITNVSEQNELFGNLAELTEAASSNSNLSDSLAFLILPVQASCPSCRKKTIDSIIKHQKNLSDGHYIIISANAGRKVINSYFREEKSELPIMPNKLFLDSVNLAYRYNLYKDKPTIYYSFNRKVYKKVASVPITVRQDLQEFFSGYRNDVEK